MSKKQHIFKRKKNPSVVVNKFLPPESTLMTGDQNPTHIVIHETSLGTGRSPENYDLTHYTDMLKEYSKNGRTVGFHYLVGDTQVYQFIPDTKSTDHTGTVFGNHNSIGIERLICKGIDYESAVHNQAQLVATLMLKYNIPIQNVYTHKQIQMEYGSEKVKSTPKQCPGRLISGFRGTVQDFKHEVERCFEYGWFFKELLTPEQIKEIPELMRIAKEAEIRRQNKLKEERRNQVIRSSSRDTFDGER